VAPPACALPEYDKVISKAQAIHMAFAELGRDADAARVRDHLRVAGVEVSLPEIEEERASLARH
jgi:hypothetical protein